MIGDIVKKAKGLGEVKDDLVTLKNEAVEIMKEIEELQKIAASLMKRQKAVMDAIGRIKDVAEGGGGKSLVEAIKKK